MQQLEVRIAPLTKRFWKDNETCMWQTQACISITRERTIQCYPHMAGAEYFFYSKTASVHAINAHLFLQPVPTVWRIPLLRTCTSMIMANWKTERAVRG